jgi:hypothetical protein
LREGLVPPTVGDWYEYSIGTSPKTGRDEAQSIKPLSAPEAERERAWASQHEPVTPKA